MIRLTGLATAGPVEGVSFTLTEAAHAACPNFLENSVNILLRERLWVALTLP